MVFYRNKTIKKPQFNINNRASDIFKPQTLSKRSADDPRQSIYPSDISYFMTLSEVQLCFGL